MADPEKYPPEELLRMLGDTTAKKRPLRDVQTCLVAGADPNGTLKQGLRPLHYGAFHNRPDVILLLIKYGADVNLGDDIGYTALHIAAKHGYLTCAQILIDNGAVVNFCAAPNDAVGEDSKVLALLTVHPLNLAIENNLPDMTELLLKNGADPNQKYFVGHEINIVPLENIECLEMLLKYGADPDAYNRAGITMLMKACKQKESRAIRMLLKHGADVEKQAHPKIDQKRAIHYAVMAGSVPATRILLNAGASTRQTAEFRFPPLEFAVTQGKVDVCRVLLEAGADPNEVNEAGCTALQLACTTPDLKHQAEIIELLLGHGGDTSYAPDEFSYITPCLTPLVEYLAACAADELDEHVLYLFFKHGAELNLTRATGRYKIKDKRGIIQLLRKFAGRGRFVEILIDVAVVRNREEVRVEGSMPPLVRAAALEACAVPVSLKHQCRITVRRLLPTPHPKSVPLLPGPQYIKDYLLFQAR